MTPGEPALFEEEAGVPPEEATKVAENMAETREIDEVRMTGEAANAAENTDGLAVIRADGRASRSSGETPPPLIVSHRDKEVIHSLWNPLPRQSTGREDRNGTVPLGRAGTTCTAVAVIGGMGAAGRVAASREMVSVLVNGDIVVVVGVADGTARRGRYSPRAARPGFAVVVAGEGSAAVGGTAGESGPLRTVHRDIHRIGAGRRG